VIYFAGTHKMNSPWLRDAVSSAAQWSYDNRAYLSQTADRMYLNKYRDYQEKTKKYKRIARGPRRLVAKRALDFGGMTPSAAKRAKFQIPYRGPTIDGKRRMLHVEQGSLAGKTLVGYLLSDIPISATDPDVTREASSILVKGCNFRVGFRNLQGCPLFVNVAVIAGKNAMPGVTSPSGINFFRNDGSTAGNNRYIDFSTGPSARQLHFMPINTEQWTVLSHTRQCLNTTGDGDVISSRANRGGGRDDFTIIDKYIKINRRLTYDSTGGDTCTTPIWLCVWCSRWDQNQNAAVVANTAECWIYGTTHFKDTN
jgi:hypothetical protein